MIPILKNKNNGSTLGFLKDVISCTVTEERNGEFELLMTYPLTGQHANLITTGRCIIAKPNDTAENQIFQIYEVTKPISGVFTVKAEHISYLLSSVPTGDVTVSSSSPSTVMALLLGNAVNKGSFGSVWSDISTYKTYTFNVGSVRSALGGTEGSVLDVYGGEFEFDNYTIKLHKNRGTDTGVIIAYRKNLTDLKLTMSMENSYTALHPYCFKDDILTVLTERVISVTNSSGIPTKTLIKDFTSFFENDEEITETALRSKANAWLDENDINAPTINLSVAFQHLWQSPEYADLQALEKVSLCDTVSVWHSELDINIKSKVVKTVYDCIGEKYTNIELGSIRPNFADTVKQTEKDIEKIKTHQNNYHSQITEEYLAAIDAATKAITGNSGGYVVLHPSKNPQELLIMNTADIDTATKMWRFNLSGFGYSSNGYDGPFKTAITMNGQINADFITTGTLTANIIRAGVLMAADGSSYFDLDSGYFSTSYANITGGYISIGSDDYRTEIIAGNIRVFLASVSTTVPIGGLVPLGSATTKRMAVYCGEESDMTGVSISYKNAKDSNFTDIADFDKNSIVLWNPTEIDGNTTIYGNLNVYNNGTVRIAKNIYTNDASADLYGSLYHYRTKKFDGKTNYTAYSVFGVGNPESRPSVAIQVNNYGNSTAIARLDVFQSYGEAMIGIKGYSDGTWSKMLELGASLWWGGNIYSKGVLVTSSEEIKENIQESTDVLDLFRNSKIYSYNYIPDDETIVTDGVVVEADKFYSNGTGDGVIIEEESPHIPYTGETYEKSAIEPVTESFGFVIERETPPQVISADGKHINMYSMTSIVWKGIQELLTRIEELEDELSKLKGA